jgi:tellurium resistance protein TerD
MELSKGGNTVLGDGRVLDAVVVGVTWDIGALDADVCALVCGPERKVLSDEHFLFWNNGATPDRSVFLRSRGADQGNDRAQVMVALADLPAGAERIVVTLATIVDGADLSSLRSLRMRLLDPHDGRELASYTMGAELTRESCLIIGELYRHQGNWKVRAVGQGYHAGLAALGTDFGVNVV